MKFNLAWQIDYRVVIMGFVLQPHLNLMARALLEPNDNTLSY